MAIEELIIPKDFTIRIRIEREDKEDLIIEEDGLSLHFDLVLAMRTAPPNDARWSFMASYLTTRWADKLEGHTISRNAALGIWGKCNAHSVELKKNSDSTQKLLPQSPE